ncbi:hypothetical protein FUT83_00940 [Treponema phagedenis]|uniref:Uncharacterized protein n=1 Tax=Treponema phagedenis TaxID=162 RepID=A0AAE6IS95_TREPH|nr:hypothetical protein FUT82_04380 [Treponema phagedenis]QEK02507.1 hypothetical protein FUT83_00940 [Treponema phagedenis]QEK08137.1 hypothetical protein FUT81_00940 [Treponema phagedenis]
MVPSRIEFENYHSYINRSFQTHRFGFDKDVKTKPLCRTLFIIDDIKIMLHYYTDTIEDFKLNRCVGLVLFERVGVVF